MERMKETKNLLLFYNSKKKIYLCASKIILQYSKRKKIANASKIFKSTWVKLIQISSSLIVTFTFILIPLENL